MPKLTAQEYIDKQARNLKNSIPDIKAGIARVTVAPGAAAVAKKTKMQTNINRALDDGTWERRTNAVSLPEWQEAASVKGTARIGAGIDAAKAKNLPMAEKLLAHIDAGQAKIKGMPNDTLDDNIQRMIAMTTHMAGAKIK